MGGGIGSLRPAKEARKRNGRPERKGNKKTEVLFIWETMALTRVPSRAIKSKWSRSGALRIDLRRFLSEESPWRGGARRLCKLGGRGGARSPPVGGKPYLLSYRAAGKARRSVPFEHKCCREYFAQGKDHLFSKKRGRSGKKS